MAKPANLRAEAVPEVVLEVLRVLVGAGHATYVVGGAVRDLLRSDPHRSASDWDVATAALPEAVTALFGKVVPTGVRHGTVTVVTRGGPVEVTTFRGEGPYSDARRPDSVEFLDDVEADLARRDFTINAMAWNPLDGEFRDPFGGVDDLAARQVRAVGAAVERFTEDGLRSIRAVRFACVLEFEIDPATLAAIPMCLASFRKVAPERVSQELSKVLLARRPAVGLVLLESTGLLEAVIPELAAVGRRRGYEVVDRVPAELEVRAAALLAPLGSEAAAEVLVRLRLPGRVVDRVRRLLLAPYAPDRPPDTDPVTVRRLLSGAGRELAQELGWLWVALSETEARPEAAEEARRLARALQTVADGPDALSTGELALSGSEVMARLGLAPGPAVGRALEWLLDAVLEDPGQNEPEALGALLDRWPGP